MRHAEEKAGDDEEADNDGDSNADDDDGDEAKGGTGGTEEVDGEDGTNSEEGWGDEVAHTPLLDGIDKDGDAVVSDDEWGMFVNAVKEELPDIADEVETALRDFNHGNDGKLNKHELGILVYHLWMNAVRQRFNHYDANSDGEVDKDELEPFADEIQQMFGLSADDLENVLDQGRAHPSAMWCARKQDAGKKWKWEECECRTPGDGKLSLCEIPVLLHAINRLADS